MEQERVFHAVCAAYAVHDDCPLHDAGPAVPEGVEMAVGVIHVHYHQVVAAGAEQGAKHRSEDCK